MLDLDSGELLPDTFQGWKQAGVSWLHDNSGFYYTAKPLEGEVAEGEHHYWHLWEVRYHSYVKPYKLRKKKNKMSYLIKII